MSETKKAPALRVVEEDLDAKLADLREQRHRRRDAAAAERKPQVAKDEEALGKLEDEHGYDRLRVLRAPYYSAGLPTLVVVKSPGGTSYWKRFQDQIRNAKGNKQLEGAAQDMLARACIVYPNEPEQLRAMCDAFPNLLNDAANAAASLGRLETEEEKKD